MQDLQRRGDLRRDGVYAVLRELRLAGCVRFERIRNEAGCVRAGRYVVSEKPAPALHPAWPDRPSQIWLSRRYYLVPKLI